VIGGGIAGPVTATVLAKAGIKATVYEGRPAVEGVGAMLSLAPNGSMRCRSPGRPTPYGPIGQPVPGSVMADGGGNTLSEFGGFPGLLATHAMARADLFRAMAEHNLAAGIAIEYGKRLVSAEETSDGVTATLGDGSTATADVLVGADGIRSTMQRPAPSTSVPIVT
jgi:2-polyprenyl-6-methoxyphenol hydroxylase-like FAD-dependent oxidoreductase